MKRSTVRALETYEYCKFEEMCVKIWLVKAKNAKINIVWHQTLPFCLINQTVYPSKEELCIFFGTLPFTKQISQLQKYSTIFFLSFITRDFVQFHLFRLRINKNYSTRQYILEYLHHRLKFKFLEDFSNKNILMNMRYTKKVKYKTSFFSEYKTF
jgi:hypothetical protein